MERNIYILCKAKAMSANLSFAVVVVVVGLTRFLPCKSMSAESCFGTKDLFYTPAPTQPQRAKGERSHTHTHYTE